MEKQTPFSLFIKQALQYPLASPFLPAPADVKKDVSYANGVKIGTYEAGTPALVWQTEQNMSLTYANALIYAEYLEADGVTVSDMPQNIWRLPSSPEIASAFVNSFCYGNPGIPGSFFIAVYYWDTYLPSGGQSSVFKYVNHIFTEARISDVTSHLCRCVKI